MEQGTLSMMATYNFNKPITATIIFEDTDIKDNVVTSTKDKAGTAKRNMYINGIQNNFVPNAANAEISIIKKSVSNEISEPQYTVHLKNTNRTCDIPIIEISQISPGFLFRSNSNITDYEVQKCFQELILNVMKRLGEMENGANTINTHLSLFADHLIFIHKIKTGVINDIQKADSGAVESATNIYSQAKMLVFEMTYSIVIYIVEPIRNISFTENFLKNTMALANEYGTPCTYRQLEIIYLEIIHWAKTRYQEMYSNLTQGHGKSNSLMHQQHEYPLSRDYDGMPSAGTCTTAYNTLEPGNVQPFLDSIAKYVPTPRNNVAIFSKQVASKPEASQNWYSYKGQTSATGFGTNNSNSNIDEGTTLTTPFMPRYTPYKQTLNYCQACHLCGQATCNKCLGCLNVYYCSEICKDLHWPIHQHVCLKSTRVYPPPIASGK